MTDKVELIKKEIERLYNQSLADIDRQTDLGLECAACTSFGKSRACKELLSFIDSLPEEPHQELYNKLSNLRDDAFSNTTKESWEACLSEEPVSEDLEKAAKNFSNNLDNIYGSIGEQTRNAFKAGAEWGKEQAEMQIKAQSIALAHGCPKEEPVCEDLEEVANQIVNKAIPTLAQKYKDGRYVGGIRDYFERKEFLDLVKGGAKWQKNHLWKLADGDELPEIDREVIALLDNGKVVFAHRPPEYWDGKDIITGKVTRNYVERYDKGMWNIPNVKYWLDVELPK